MNAIAIRDLTKRYKDVTAVDELSLNIKKGELFALLGVNGAGKTITVKMLSCLIKPDSGDALIHGKSILTEMAEVKKIIAVSPQETAVAMNLTVEENLRLMTGIHGYGKDEANKKIAALTQKLGLSGVLKKRAGKLSGGYMRRLSIAMALITDPEVLFLDEPTLGLDMIARSKLWDVIRALTGKVTVILTTHYMEEAEQLSDRIGIMKDGKLLLVGTADEIKQKAQTDRFEDAFVKVVKEEIK